MSLQAEMGPRPNNIPHRTIISRWHRLQATVENCNGRNQKHMRGEQIFNNAIRDLPGWIDPANTLWIIVQNTNVIRPFAKDPKLQGGLDNLGKLQADIV
jgi:hypothetical protein